MEKIALSAEDVRVALAPLNMAQIQRLAQLSGVPFHTIYKIRNKETTNPGIETVRQFMPHIAAASSGLEVRASRRSA